MLVFVLGAIYYNSLCQSWFILCRGIVLSIFFQVLFVTIPILNLGIFLNIESLFNFDLNNVLNYFGSILWIVLLINSINFIDNMDGLAVVVTGSICSQSIILTYLLNQYKLTDVSVVLLFVILGFFIFNFPPAKLYLGDSGSLFIGFCLLLLVDRLVRLLVKLFFAFFLVGFSLLFIVVRFVLALLYFFFRSICYYNVFIL